MFRAIEAKTDKAPNYRVVSPTTTDMSSFGAAWQKRSEEGRGYLGLLDDRSICGLLTAILVPTDSARLACQPQSITPPSLP